MNCMYIAAAHVDTMIITSWWHMYLIVSFCEYISVYTECKCVCVCVDNNTSFPCFCVWVLKGSVVYCLAVSRESLDCVGLNTYHIIAQGLTFQQPQQEIQV